MPKPADIPMEVREAVLAKSFEDLVAAAQTISDENIERLIKVYCRGSVYALRLRVLLDHYLVRHPDLQQYDPELLRAIWKVSRYLGELPSAIAVQKVLIAKKNRFFLSDYLDLGFDLFCNGQFAEADQLIRQSRALASNLLQKVIEIPGSQQGVVRPIGWNNFSLIGELSIQPDIYFKACHLRWLTPTPHDRLIYDDSLFHNRALVDYWQEKVPLIPQSSLHPNGPLRPIEECHDTLLCLDVPGLGGVGRNLAYQRLNQIWSERRLPPVLRLKPDHLEQGRRHLASFGLAEDQPFVALHVREMGWLGRGGHRTDYHNEYRCASIESYLPLIEALTARGLWVIRLGDATMTPLPPLPRVFDYALSPFKSHLLDVFLCAAARFMIGTQSGLCQVATLFGVPVVLTNALANDAILGPPENVVVFKKYYSEPLGRYLPIRDCYRPPLVCNDLKDLFFTRQIRPEENTPEELIDAALLMLDQLEGRELYTPGQRVLLERFRRHANFTGTPLTAWIGRRYLEAIAELMPEEGEGLPVAGGVGH